MSITSLASITIGLNILLLAAIYWYFRLEVAQRQQTETILRQQTDRERLVNNIAQHIRQSLDLDEVLAITVEEVQQFLQADRVLIYRLQDDGVGCVIHETVLSPYTEILGQIFPEEVFPQEAHQAYSQGKVRTIAHIDQADIEPCLIDFMAQFEIQAKLVVPIIQDNRYEALKNCSNPPISYLWGLLIVHQCHASRNWETWEVELMKYLATQVAIAIQQSELYDQLQQLNTQLGLRVRERTAELATANQSLRTEVAERKRTELALRHSNDTLQALIKASPRAIMMLDLDGKVKIWNPAAEHMFGWTETEVFDRPNPIDLSYHQTAHTALQSSILQGTTYSRLEFQQSKKDGTPIDVIFSAAPLPDSEGRISGMVAVIADITERKQQAEQVRLLQSVVLNTNDAVIITEAEPIDEPGPRILYVNEAFTRITGYQPEEVLGKTPRILQGSNTDPAELRKVRHALVNWEPVTVEVVNCRKDGSEFWNEFSLVPVADAHGWYTHWIAVQRDTTGRKRVEQALRQSEKRFRSLIEHALDIVMILDVGGAIAYISPSAEKVLGYGITELVGKPVAEFIHADDWLTIRDRLTNLIPNPELTRPIEFRCRHHDQSWRILEAISQPFSDSITTQRVMVNARDITERKRLDEIRLALEREKELSELKTRFFSMVSHEFRTPLSTALAAAQVLENSQDKWDNIEKRMRNLQRIQDSVRNMVQLLDDILTINRAETGKLAFNPKMIDLGEYCRQFMEEMQLNASAQHKLTCTCHGTAQSVYLDDKLLRSILSNLVSNAIKYSPKGGDIQLGLMFKADQVQICVRDEGIGIPVKDQKHLFEPFHRGQNVRSIPGTGLGLAVVKKCVDLHQGTISIASEVGAHTVCQISLPYGLK